MKKLKFNYANLGYWFLLLILFAFAGFYTTYFSKLFLPTPYIIHFHFVLLALWVFMLIAQPFLIKYKKLSTHRLLGKVSYLLVPLVLITSWLLTRNEYYRKIDILQNDVTVGLQDINQFEILKKASVDPAAFISIIWFITFYSLAITFRKKATKHARYMLATALILLSTCLLIFIFGQLSFYIMPNFDWWASLMEVAMMPKP